MENTENMVEFISGARTATVSFTNRKHINRIKNQKEALPHGIKKMLKSYNLRIESI